MNTTLEQQIFRLIFPGGDRRPDWVGALAAINEVLDGAVGEARGIALVLRAVVLWRQSVKHVHHAKLLVDEALTLVPGNPVATVKALLDGCQMAELSLDTERHRTWSRELRQILGAPGVGVETWLGHIWINVAYYWQTTGESPGRAMGAFREAIAFFQSQAGPRDERDRACQLRHCYAALGDLLLSLGHRGEAGVQYALARRCGSSDDEGDAGRSAVFYLEGRLHELDGHRDQAAEAYRQGIALAGRHKQDHRGLLRLVEGLAGVYQYSQEHDAVRAVLLPLIVEFREAEIPQIVLRLQQLAMPTGGEEAVC